MPPFSSAGTYYKIVIIKNCKRAVDDGKREKAGASSLSPFPSSPGRFHFSCLSLASRGPLRKREGFFVEKTFSLWLIICLGKFIRTLGVEEHVEQVPVVQKVDSAIHRINHYSVDTRADLGEGCRGCGGGGGVEQETSAPPPKKNPRSAPRITQLIFALLIRWIALTNFLTTEARFRSRDVCISTLSYFNSNLAGPLLRF